MKYLEIQNDVINRYNIDRVCKWKCANSIQSTFALLHEIGHIETTKSKMRRAEAEYHATIWAMIKCKEYGLDVPGSIIKVYQDYINIEIERGKRRGGSGYGDLTLVKERDEI